MSDSQNAFKVRLSIKTALGDNAVSKVSSYILLNSLSAKVELLQIGKVLKGQTIFSTGLTVINCSLSHNPGILS